jgi:hypothetical protein
MLATVKKLASVDWHGFDLCDAALRACDDRFELQGGATVGSHWSRRTTSSSLIRVETSPGRWHGAIGPLRDAFRESAQKILLSKKSLEQAEARRRKGQAEAWSPEGFLWKSYQRDGQVLRAIHRPRILRAGLESYERGLRILNALSFAAEARSFTVLADQKEGRLRLDGHGGFVTLRITEKYSKQKGEYGDDRVPAGILRLYAGRYSFSEKEFSDSPGQPLESQLNEIFVKIYPVIVLAREENREIAEGRRQAAIQQQQEREAAEKRKAEAERIELENKRRAELLHDAENWAKANTIRQYVNHALASPPRSHTTEDLQSWGRWALEVADELDPTVAANTSKPR